MFKFKWYDRLCKKQDKPVIKKIKYKDYEKAEANLNLQDSYSMLIKEEVKGCLFIYDDEFKEWFDKIPLSYPLNEWLEIRRSHNLWVKE